MKILHAVVLTLTMALGAATRGSAQTAADHFAAGVRAYDDLQFIEAEERLHRSLAAVGDSALIGAVRSQALAYLGAAEWFNGQHDAATGTFQALILRDPGFRLDTLRFPPAVTSAYESVRHVTYAVRATAEPSLGIRAGNPEGIAALQAATPHRIVASLVGRDGHLVRRLYDGWITDTLTLSWDGRDDAGPVDNGTYTLLLGSFNLSDRLERQSRLPVEVTVFRRDTLPYPSRPGTISSSATLNTPAALSLAWGMLTTGAAIALPQAVAPGPTSRGNVIIAGTIGVATVAGLLRATTTSEFHTAALDRDRANARWRDSIAVIRQENARRREEVNMIVRVGAPQPAADDR